MNCNVNRQHVLSLFDTLHDKYQFKDGEYKDFVETLAGKNVDDEDEDELPDYDEIVPGTLLERRYWQPRADEDANPVLIHEVNEFVDTTLQLMKQMDFYYDVVDILIANTRMEDEKHEHLVWKDNGQRVTDDDEAKLLRIVKSTKSLPTGVRCVRVRTNRSTYQQEYDVLEYDVFDGWFDTVESLLHCVFWELFVPIYVNAFGEHTFLHDNGTDVYTLWKDNAKRVTHCPFDNAKFDCLIQDFHDQLLQEWKNRTGRFAPIDPVLAEKMNHSETVKQVYGVPTD